MEERLIHSNFRHLVQEAEEAEAESAAMEVRPAEIRTREAEAAADTQEMVETREVEEVANLQAEAGAAVLPMEAMEPF